MVEKGVRLLTEYYPRLRLDANLPGDSSGKAAVGDLHDRGGHSPGTRPPSSADRGCPGRGRRRWRHITRPGASGSDPRRSRRLIGGELDLALLEGRSLSDLLVSAWGPELPG